MREFEYGLENNIFSLHGELAAGTYVHGGYRQFRVNDPKPRLISKASVRDRLVHRAAYRALCPAFDKSFIYDSYACRALKGTHRAFERLMDHVRSASRNYRSPCWALKCDIRKFFDSVDHAVLKGMLREGIADERILCLLNGIIGSFHASPGKGLPLGNLTSQLFANIYMDRLDKFVVHGFGVRRYARYADDFVIVSPHRDFLTDALDSVRRFCTGALLLDLHPQKISLRKLSWGIDFVGYVALPHHAVLRKKTVERIFRNARSLAETDPEGLRKRMPSYLGHMSHASARGISQTLRGLASG